MPRYHRVIIPPHVAKRVHEMPDLGYCRRMYFGPSRLMNLWHLRGLEQTLNLVRLEPGDRVLDLGCADGLLLNCVESYAAFAVGVDVQNWPLRWCRRLDLAHKIAQANGKELPFPDSSFDKVFCLEVLEHVENPNPVIREIMRVLRPGGTAVVTVPIEIGPPLLIKQLTARLLAWKRTDIYTWSQLWRVGVRRSVKKIPHVEGHFGYDFRITEAALRDALVLKRRTFLPVPILGSLCNLRVAFVADRR